MCNLPLLDKSFSSTEAISGKPSAWGHPAKPTVMGWFDDLEMIVLSPGVFMHVTWMIANSLAAQGLNFLVRFF